MRYFITIPFNIHTYRKVLNRYWKGESDNNGSLGFFKKTDKSKVKKFHKYFFGGRVPINCMDYIPPFFLPKFDNVFTDWTPLYIDDMMVTFKTGEGERLCSRYIFMVDELEDNEIIAWEERGATMIGAFNSETGSISVAIKWDLDYKTKLANNRYESKEKYNKIVYPDKPSLIIEPELKVDIHNDIIPIKVNWDLYSKDYGLRGIRFAVSIEKQVLGDLVEKRLKTHKITLAKYLKAGDMDSAIKLGTWMNRLKSVLSNCRNYDYRI